MKAREEVEHRLASFPSQETLVQQWTENPTAMAARHYPQYEVLSYPVQTRIQREIEKLQRYNYELPERLEAYASALQAIERTSEEVQARSKRESDALLVPWPSQPNILTEDPWPTHWPKRYIEPSPTHLSQPRHFSFNTHRPLPPRRLPAPRRFTLTVAGLEIDFESRYEDGISPFITSLNDFLKGPASSRWPAIIEATRCGIRWPQLDRYLQECDKPWLPTDLVTEEFGLRGTLEQRDCLADLMAQVSAPTGRWYLSQHPGRTRLHKNIAAPTEIIEELVASKLLDWGPEMPPGEMLKEIPFEEVKSMLAMAGIWTPRSRNAQIKMYDKLVSVQGESAVGSWIREFVDPSTVIEVCEPQGWNREARLGPRARANVMVSTLVLLHEGDAGPRQILKWGL